MRQPAHRLRSSTTTRGVAPHHPGPSSNSSSSDSRGRSRPGGAADASSDALEQHSQQQAFAPPAWHPRLLGLPPCKRAGLEATARQLYQGVWNEGCLSLLDELADDGVCFSDVIGMDTDAFSCASLKALIGDFQATHPLLRYELEDVIVDAARDTVVVHYTVTAAHLLPQPVAPDAAPAAAPTGHVSVVGGMDKLRFNKQGLISSIQSFRQRFTEEEVEPIDWESV